MDLTNSTVKTPEAETETPTRIQPVKPSPFTNGVLKRHAPLHHHHHHHPIVVTYKECLKNHAAAIGGHAVDGCGEFMPSPTTNPVDPSSLKCAACGCHRNFHRREPDETPLLPPNSIPALEYQRHHPPPPPPPPRENSESSPNNSPSPPPISSAYYPSAPHMLLALGHGPPQPHDGLAPNFTNSTSIFTNSSSRKRFRTKFTQDQREKMLELAYRVGWKMQKRDKDLINGFCTGIGVDKGVFKVWMHNNKNNFGKKDQSTNTPQLTINNIAISTPPPTTAVNGGSGVNYGYQHGGDREVKENFHGPEIRSQVIGTNGSSSS